MIGPMEVPKEFKAPPNVILCEPVEGSPNNIANGFAAVCCNENPNARIKNAIKNKLNPEVGDPIFTVTIIAMAPNNETNNQ